MKVSFVNSIEKNKTITICMVLFFSITFHSNSQQTIEGTVTEEIGKEPIPNTSILIKNAKDSLLIDYTHTNANGNYTIQLTKDLDSVFIETSIISHLSKIQILILNQNKKIYTLNFSLKPRITELEEIYIEGKKEPIVVKKDTTVYNIIQFKDGSERVVEDLLKKLPGISIADNGVIKFKGKQVTRVLFDGDNVFNDNYSIGTKNIDSEIVESVQAIEDYNSNPLLKGIKSSEDVAVNLILKKGETDISGNAEIGLGHNDKRLIKANIISVSKKLKGFSTISYNNIGENYSPYNFISNIFELSKINEIKQRTNNLVNNSGFNSSLPINRISVNENFYGSINSLFKINEKASFRVNYDLFKDKLKRNELYNTFYNFDDSELSILNTEYIIKKPLINTLEFEFIYNINKKSLLTSVGKWDSQSIKKSSFGLNNNSSFPNSTKSNDVFLKNDIEYTYRIDAKNVFQLSSKISSNDIPQNVDVLYENNDYKQVVDFKKNYFNFQVSSLSKIKENELAFDLGYDFAENFIDSKLDGVDVSNQFLANNYYYKSTKFYANLKYIFRAINWRFISQLKNDLYDIKLSDTNLETSSTETFYNIQPKFSINYYLNKESHIYWDYTLSNNLPKANNVYSGLILINNRALLNNIFSFNLFNNHSTTFGYRVNDFYNLFQFNAFGKYNFRKYGHINQLNIDEDTSFYTSIVDITNNKGLDFGVELEKYIHFFKTTFNFDSSYSINEYQNIINNSELRNNKSKTFSGQFEIRTGFKANLNFENKILVTNNVFSNLSGTTNSFTLFQNDFTTKYMLNDFQFILNSQYFNPDLSKKTSGDLFLDLQLRYKSKKSNIEYQIKSNNLLNKKIYRNIDNSDFSTSIFEHNLVERFILFSIDFRF